MIIQTSKLRKAIEQNEIANIFDALQRAWTCPGAVPDQIQEGEEILVPTFEIADPPPSPLPNNRESKSSTWTYTPWNGDAVLLTSFTVGNAVDVSFSVSADPQDGQQRSSTNDVQGCNTCGVTL